MYEYLDGEAIAKLTSDEALEKAHKLSDAFNWKKSPEGREFWNSQYWALIQHSEKETSR